MNFFNGTRGTFVGVEAPQKITSVYWLWLCFEQDGGSRICAAKKLPAPSTHKHPVKLCQPEVKQVQSWSKSQSPPQGEDKHLPHSPAEVQSLRRETPMAHLPEAEQNPSNWANRAAPTQNSQFGRTNIKAFLFIYLLIFDCLLVLRTVWFMWGCRTVQF